MLWSLMLRMMLPHTHTHTSSSQRGRRQKSKNCISHFCHQQQQHNQDIIGMAKRSIHNLQPCWNCLLKLLSWVKTFNTRQINRVLHIQQQRWISFDSDLASGGNEDDEPDKMAIAFGRFGTFKRFLVSTFFNNVLIYRQCQKYIVAMKARSVKNFFVFLKNKIIEAVTGRRPYVEEFDEGEKGYQVIF